MTTRPRFRPLFGRKSRPRHTRSLTRPRLETLEARLAPAVLLTYGGPGTVLGLLEQASAATPAVSISEPAPGQLKIDLGASTFDPTSTAAAPGLTYQIAGSPATSHSADIDIGQANNITTLQATLPGDSLTLGVIADASGGLSNVTASAGVINVTGLDTSHASAGNGNVDLTAAGALTVAPQALLDTGMGTISLAADVNADGTGNSNSGVLFIASGATVVSDNPGSSAITLRGAAIDIDTSADPGLVGARRDVLSTSPTATLTGLNGPRAMAFDASGNLFVANSNGTTVSEFAPGSTTPTAILTGLDEPSALAFDAHGTLFVANKGHVNKPGTTVSEFAPGSTTPTATITGREAPSALAFDARGNLFVANYNDSRVFEFAPGSTTPFGVLFSPSLSTIALAFDAGGNLFVANSGNTVSEFAPGSTTPTATLTGLNGARALAFDARGNLFVANFNGTTVSEFAPGSTAPTATLTGLNDPIALAFDAQGNLFVANEGDPTGTVGSTVSEFAPGSTTPTATLTGLSSPGALAFDGRGNLFVANLTNNTVSEYALEPAAGGVVIRTAQPGQSISIGANSGTGLAISNAELAQIFTTASGAITFGDPSQTGDIDVTGNVSSHPGFATLSLQTQNGKINEANGATITVANLALHAGTGIGTTGDFRTAVTKLAFANQSGAIHISNTGAVTLTNVDSLTGASIPGNIHSSSVVGSVYTLLHSSDGIKGQISYNGQPLADGATLVLADGNRYQISYKANGGHDVTLTRIANVERAKVLDQTIRDGRAAALGFWADAAGLALIRRFNGGPTSQALASWLAATLPNLYGAGAGTHDITGLTNAKVADLLRKLSRARASRPEAQVLATALDVYATTRSLGGSAARRDGFRVTALGLGATPYTLGARGDALGVRSQTVLDVDQILAAANESAVDAVLDDGNATLRHRADELFTEINTGK